MTLVLPGIPAPSEAPAVDMANFTASAEILGLFRQFRARFTGVYSAVEMSVIQRVFTMLHTGGTLAKLDCLSFKMANEADSLINWCGDNAAVNNGAAFGAKGFVLDGVDDWIAIPADLTGNGNYKVNDAHLGVYVSEDRGVSRFVAIGRVGAGWATHLFPRFSGGSTRFRINSDANTDGVVDRPIVGLWSAGVLAGESRQYLFHGAGSVMSSMAEFIGIPAALGVGRYNDEYAAMTTSGWFTGGYFTSPHRVRIANAFEIMRATFVAS